MSEFLRVYWPDDDEVDYPETLLLPDLIPVGYINGQVAICVERKQSALVLKKSVFVAELLNVIRQDGTQRNVEYASLKLGNGSTGSP